MLPNKLNISIFASLAVLALIALTIFHPAQVVQSQRPVRQHTIKQLIEPMGSSPIELANLEINGRSTNFGDSIESGNDFLTGLSFEVQNTSKKPINYIMFGLHLYNTDNANKPDRIF